MLWENLREEEFEEAIERSKGVCVLPIGCLEKHGQHLPVGTDSLVANGICCRAAELEEVMVFPTGMWLGDSMQLHPAIDPGAERKRGYIAINPHTLLTLLGELCDEIARNGFRKILICNIHGGNQELLSFFTRAQGYSKKEYATMYTHLWTKVNGKDQSIRGLRDAALADPDAYPMLTKEDMGVLEHWCETGTGGGHADFNETASVLGLHPELVRPDKYEQESGRPTHRPDHLIQANINSTMAFWDANYPNAYNGYAPIGCTETIGQALIEYRARCLAEAFKVLKEDEECVRIARKYT